MKSRQLAFSFAPTPVNEAKGVTIQRAVGAERMALLDPILLLDHASIAPGSPTVGFPRHPHRGIETLSYVLAGEVGHKDSIGNDGTVGANGSQWMTAGNGIFHEEMLVAEADGAEMIQLWFSLPKALKRVPPAYVGAEPSQIPLVGSESGNVRVVAGSYEGTDGPFQGIAVRPTVLDVELNPGGQMEIPTEPGASTIAYAVRGSLVVDGHTLPAPRLLVFADGDQVEITAGPNAGRFLFVSAQPLNEPVLQFRSFVMNTPEDIQETLAMIASGEFGK